MHSVTYQEVLSNFDKIAALAEQGEEIVITRESHPNLKLIVEKPASTQRVLGLHAGISAISDDFDDELDDTFWLGNNQQ
tara:strand:+ start:517 stop:753 length:237 start_codon:yes stop_codon:yes gene_type:complete